MSGSKTTKPATDRRTGERRVAKATFPGGDKRAEQRRKVADRRADPRI